MLNRQSHLRILLWVLAGFGIGQSQAAAENNLLFTPDLPAHQWLDFEVDGFGHPVSGIVFRKADPPACGVPLGGLGTGCLDIDEPANPG